LTRLVEKYRPKVWADIVGQEKVIQTIKKVIERGWTLPHMLFSGPAGVGKTSAALVISSVTGIPILEYNASDARGIDDVRYEIKKQAQYKMKQILFLDEADMMTDPAQHALRRIMETTDSIFILSGNDEWRFLDAIKSRCAIFRFRRIPDDVIEKRIVEIIRAEGVQVHANSEEEKKLVIDSIKLLVKKANGDLRTAINDLEKVIGENKTITPESIAIIQSSVGMYVLAMNQALAGKFEDAKTTIEKAYVEGNYDSRVAFKELYEAIPSLTASKDVKIRLFEKLGEAEGNSNRGSNPIVQVISFLAFVWLVPYLSPCPILSKGLGSSS
jgi:replication factor C small subunit